MSVMSVMAAFWSITLKSKEPITEFYFIIVETTELVHLQTLINRYTKRCFLQIINYSVTESLLDDLLFLLHKKTLFNITLLFRNVRSIGENWELRLNQSVI